MILPDINLLVYAYNETAPSHGAALAWWRGLMDGEQAAAMPWATIFGFVRIVTHPAVLADPLRPAKALDRAVRRAWWAPSATP